jgi:protein TonB
MQLKYPEPARNKKIKGKVFVKISIDQEGRVIDAKVLKGIGYGCDEEALRLASLLRFKQSINKNRIVSIGMPIIFGLP